MSYVFYMFISGCRRTSSIFPLSLGTDPLFSHWPLVSTIAVLTIAAFSRNLTPMIFEGLLYCNITSPIILTDEVQNGKKEKYCGVKPGTSGKCAGHRGYWKSEMVAGEIEGSSTAMKNPRVHHPQSLAKYLQMA